MRARDLGALLVLLVLLLTATACGGESAGDTASGESGGSQTTEVGETIVLPAGWELFDAVSATDVEGVLGATGYEQWVEPLSDAAAGKPQGGYATADGAPSKIGFLVYAQNGQAEFDRVADFVEGAQTVPGDLWDQAIIGDLTDGADQMKVVLLRKGDVTMRILWSPDYYASWDQTELGTKLGTMLVGRLFGS
jgi:hypothetical protein